MGRRPRRDRPVGDRPVGCLRDHYSAAARGGPLPPHQVLLPHHLAFLALVIGYFPVIYQAFSRREMAISLLDARAGSPPTAGELLWRYRWDKSGDALAELLREWERWSADVLESHLSYPALAYFRSQHYNQSWLGALTTILDVSALVMVGLEGGCVEQARLTFAMARHAGVDLAQVFNTPR